MSHGPFLTVIGTAPALAPLTVFDQSWMQTHARCRLRVERNEAFRRERAAGGTVGGPCSAATHVADRVVVRVHEDDLEVLVGGVLMKSECSKVSRQIARNYDSSRSGAAFLNSCVLTSFTQYEFSTRRPPHLRPARSSATLLRLRFALSCVMPWFTGLPYTWPCAHESRKECSRKAPTG